MACRQSKMEFIRVLLLKLASWLLRLLNTKTNEQQITFTNVLNYKKVLNDHSLMYRWCMICRQIKQNWSV